ncbi:hypothetical protein JN531_012265 [Flagellatimonas centrodinii]|uniref:hypothetical protein n=1 Tax=Flagellatimonas centrodinii TaxID=2806210 RepID=UPI001FEE424D|nr:hypothetical protein [Flagellatimonas centrodinii]ULQ45875.1 hypothetical protein JN531_012265 [Flagellatimonas centrodinii]
MATIGKLMVLWGTDIQGLVSGNEKAKRSSRDASSSMQRSADQARKGFSLLGSKIVSISGIAGFGLLTKSAIASGDALAKAGDKLGIATERLAGLRVAAERSGVASNTLDMAMQRMTRRVAEAAHGTGEAKDAIKELGLDAQALARMAPDQQFRAIAESMSQIEGQGQKVRLSFKLFDSEGVALVNTLARGAEGLNEAQAEAEALGLALTRVEAAKLEQVSDAGARSADSIKGIGNQLALALAPGMAAASNKMAALVAQTGGFRNEIQFAMDLGVNAVGLFADGLHGIKVVWKGIEIVGRSTMTGTMQLLQTFGMAAEAVLNTILKGVNRTLKAVNAISPWDVPLQEMLDMSTAWEQLAQKAYGGTLEAVAELNALLMQPLPSDQIRAAMEKIAADAEARAREIAAARSTALDGGGGGTPTDDKAKKALERERQRIEERLQMVRDATATEGEIEYQRYQERLAALQAADATMFEYEGERDLLKEQLYEQHLKRMEDIRKKNLTALEKFNESSWGAQVETVAGALTDMTAGVANSSKTMFKINKVAAIANAVVNTAQGVTKALAEYPPPISGIMAGIQLAAGMAQVNAIKNTQFGGGVAPSQATTPATPVAPIQQEEQRPQQQVTLMLDSDRTRFHRDEVISMAQGLSDLFKDGGGVGGLRVAFAGGN